MRGEAKHATNELATDADDQPAEKRRGDNRA